LPSLRNSSQELLPAVLFTSDILDSSQQKQRLTSWVAADVLLLRSGAASAAGDSLVCGPGSLGHREGRDDFERTGVGGGEFLGHVVAEGGDHGGVVGTEVYGGVVDVDG